MPSVVAMRVIAAGLGIRISLRRVKPYPLTHPCVRRGHESGTASKRAPGWAIDHSVPRRRHGSSGTLSRPTSSAVLCTVFLECDNDGAGCE
jgi:hypothetical protein